MQDQASEFFGLPEAWSQRLNIPLETLVERMRDVPAAQAVLPGATAPQAAYLESDVKRVCADLIRKADDVRRE